MATTIHGSRRRRPVIPIAGLFMCRGAGSASKPLVDEDMMIFNRSIRPERLTLLVSLGLVLFYNLPFWRKCCALSARWMAGHQAAGILPAGDRVLQSGAVAIQLALYRQAADGPVIADQLLHQLFHEPVQGDDRCAHGAERSADRSQGSAIC
jgi:hypothetical protein